MASHVRVYGFGNIKRPFVDRAPMKRARFTFPKGYTVHGAEINAKDNYFQVTVRIPLPEKGEPRKPLLKRIFKWPTSR